MEEYGNRRKRLETRRLSCLDLRFNFQGKRVTTLREEVEVRTAGIENMDLITGKLILREIENGLA
jgi:hypothetical protein